MMSKVLVVLGMAAFAGSLISDFLLRLPAGRLHMILDVCLVTALAAPYIYSSISRESRLRLGAEAAERRRARMRAAFYDIAGLAARDMSPGNMLDAVLEKLLAADWLQAEPCGRVFLLGHDRSRLVLKACRGRGMEPEACADLAVEASCCGLALQSGRVEFLPQDPAACGGGQSCAPGRVHYCAPIKFGGECSGVMQLYAGPGYIRDEQDEAFLAAVGSVVGLILAHRDAEAERLRLGAAVGSAAEAVVVTDTHGIICYANPAFSRMTGRSRGESLGRALRSVNPCRKDNDAVYDRIFSAVGRGEVWQGRLSCKRQDGSDLEAAATISMAQGHSGKVLNYVAVLRDITAELSLEDQVRQAQKLEAVGLLAGGIAHDFNNVLTTIIGYNYFILDGLEAGSPLRAFSQEIRRSADVAASLSRQILSISRKQPAKLRVMDINTVIMDTAKMFRRLLGENIQLVMETHPALWPVKMDSGQLEQVILNLIINARDAMPKGGRLTLSTKNISVTPDSRPDPAISLPPGIYVCLEVHDTGLGMDEKVQSKIFEPFYTTKQKGQGSGLGLPTVMGIVRQHKGFVSVASRIGKGSVFRVYFPRAEGGMDALFPGEAPKSMRGGHETIMVVEDNDALRSMIKRTLRLKGYRVFSQAGGEEALKFLRTHREEVQLLLADLVLGDMDGVELAGQATSLRPGLKVAYMSGYTGSIMTMAGAMRESVIIEKPFTPESLLGSIRKLLDCVRVPKAGS